jgi:hypothetical protein
LGRRMKFQGWRLFGYKVEPFFRWYDLWIGAFVDIRHHALYLCPLPMFGLKISRCVPLVVVTERTLDETAPDLEKKDFTTY